MTILNAIEDFEAKATDTSELSEARTRAMDYYLGKPFGGHMGLNEVEGRSQVVSMDVSETVELIKPSLIRIFTAGDEVVAFAPQNQEDIAAAQQETDYVNYIISQKNNWLPVCYTWFTDALLQINGYVKAYWDERTEVTPETYRGLTVDQLALIANDPEVTIQAYEPYVDPAYPQFPYYNVSVLKRRTYGCVKFLNIPPERVIVDGNFQDVSLDKCQFVEHWEWKTMSQLKEEGFQVPANLADEGPTLQSDTEEQARNRYNEDVIQDDDTGDPALRK